MHQPYLLDVGSDLGAGEEERPGAGTAAGGTVRGVGHLPGQAAMHVTHLVVQPRNPYSIYAARHCILYTLGLWIYSMDPDSQLSF